MVFHKSCHTNGEKSIERDWGFEARIKAAIRYIVKGLYKKALIALEDAGEEYAFCYLVPSHPYLFAHIYNLRGICYLQMGLYEEAIFNFKKALLERPTYGSAYYNLGTALFRLERYDEAMEVFRKGVGLDPNYDPYLKEAIDGLRNLRKGT